MGTTFEDFISKLERYEHVVKSPGAMGPVQEFWKEVTPGLYQCLVTGRKLSKVDFRIYQNHSACGPAGFVVGIF